MIQILKKSEFIIDFWNDDIKFEREWEKWIKKTN
jgi:hypothetical protein